MQAGGELVRLIRLALDRDHESALAIDGGADGGNAAGDCLIDILLAGEMRGGALGVAEFHGACLDVEFAVDKLAERLGSAGEYRVAERIEPRLVRPEFVSLCVFHALAGDDDAVAELSDDFLDLGQKLILIERDFRHQNEVWPVGGFALGQHGAGGEPAGGAAHDLDDAAGAVIGGHAGDVLRGLHHRRGVVLDRAAVARRVVGVWQVVVDCFRHADAAQRVAAFLGLEMHLVVGVLRVVAAGVKEIANVVRLEDLEQPVHVEGSLFGVFIETNLVAAGAQRGARSVLEFLDGAGLLLVQVDQVFVQDAKDAVKPAVNLHDLIRVFAGFLDDAGHAGVDDRRGAAGLAHQHVAHQFAIDHDDRGFRFGVQVVNQRVSGFSLAVCCRVIVFQV